MEQQRDTLSPSFDRFLSGAGPNDRCEAIVLYRPAPLPRGLLARGRRALRRSAGFLRLMAEGHRRAQRPLFAALERAGAVAPGARGAPPGAVGRGILPVARLAATRDLLLELAGLDGVVAVLPNQRVRPIAPRASAAPAEAVAADLERGITWGLEALEVREFWSKARTKGKGALVGVLDTGVHAGHEALAGRVRKFVAVDPLGRRIAARPPFDAGRHGTHVCGTICGGEARIDGRRVRIGVAPDARVAAAAVLLGEATLLSVIEAMAWAVECGSDVLNLSLGFTYYEPQFDALLQALVDTFGIVPVVAIGNENHGNTSCPGNVPHALAVGALARAPDGQHEVAAFSSGASLVFPAGAESRLITKPDLSAPGVGVLSAIPPESRPDGLLLYEPLDGTSMATPHVAGAAALLAAARPEASAAHIIAALKETASHPTGARPDNRFGYGCVRPLAALAAL